jgi:hypothetical protein
MRNKGFYPMLKPGQEDVLHFKHIVHERDEITVDAFFMSDPGFKRTDAERLEYIRDMLEPFTITIPPLA